MQRAYCLTPLFVLMFLSMGLSQATDGRIIAGDSTQLHELHTQRGDVFWGTLMSAKPDSVFFRLSSGLEIRFAAAEVSEIRLLEMAEPTSSARKLHSRPEETPDLGAEMLLFSPTAFIYPKGSSEYRNTLLSVNDLDAGLSDHFSIGGTVILPTLAGIRAKAGAQLSPSTRIAAGGAFYYVFFTGNNSSAAHLYGVLTHGKPERFINLTVGMAGTLTGSWIPVISGGGAYQFHPKWRLMGDIGYAANSGDALIFPSFSFSWLGPRRRVDFGLLSVNLVPIPIPYARFALKF